MAYIKKIKLPSGQIYDIYDAGALRASDLEQAKTAIKSEILGSAPEELNTLEELAAALGSDENFSTTILNLIGSQEETFNEKIAEVESNNSAVVITKDGESRLLDTFNIVKLSREEYDALVNANSINPDALYLIEGENEDVALKSELEAKIAEVESNNSAVVITKDGESRLLDTFNIIKLSQEEYDALVDENSINPDALYFIEGEDGVIIHPDWNETNVNSPGFILNKPFYDNGQEVVQLDEKFIPDSIARIEDVALKSELDGKLDLNAVSFNQTQTTGNEIGKLTINDTTTTLYSPIATKAGLGLGNVENKSSATIRNELTSKNVTDALGYTPPTQDTTYNVVTTTVDGLMTAEDKAKLDGISSGADAVSFTQTQTTGNEIGKIIINSNETVLYSPSVTKASIGLGNVENKSSATIRSEITSSNVTTALGYTPPRQDTTYNNASTTAAGLMSAADKVKLDGLSNSSPNVLTSLPSSGTALTANSIYNVSSNVGTYKFRQPANGGWAHGKFKVATTFNITFYTGSTFIGAAPSIEAGKTYEFDVYNNIWAIQEVVSG